MTSAMKSPTSRRNALVFLIVVIALNLRPFLAAPGPILPQIAEATGLSFGQLSLLTLLPMLLMGIGAFASPLIHSLIGTRCGLLLALALLFLGVLLRIFAENGTLLILTAGLCGLGVAFIQSVVPGVIKEEFSTSVAGMTGLYSATIMTGGAVGAQLTPAFVEWGLDWTTALSILSLPIAVAFLVATILLSETGAVRATPGLVVLLLGRRRTWALIAVFGLINGGYSSMIAWLAPYYQAQGWSSSESAFLVSTMAIFQGFGAVLMPLLARTNCDRRPWLLVCIVLQAAGFVGLIIAPLAFPVVWAAICGAGLAGSFALCLIVALDHFPDTARAGPLAAIMQGGGFIIAATPPFILSQIHAATGSFIAGWTMHLAWLAIAAAFVSRLDPGRYPEVMEWEHQGG